MVIVAILHFTIALCVTYMQGIKDSSLFADAKEVFIDPGSMQGYSNGSPLPARTKTNE